MKCKALRLFSRSSTVALLAAATLVPGGAFASTADVHITFAGRYVPLSCNVQAGSEAITVELPTVAARSLASPGDVAGATRFEIPIECEGTIGTVRAYFQAGVTVDANGRLIPQDASPGVAAQGVRVELLNESGSVIRVGDKTSVTPISADGSEGILQLVYFARYYGTGGATAGVVNTYVNYVLDIP
ncbi:fimbrial protein [Achromobacter seleniivolatilans]|uniref:Fimbrial protein n=1 Tax=Achromobacter seleniivolatilans TaxID=3047478 RepID=A0ABY9LZW1_9BURK|nr:fimbrial protein [Achromobacter sp. R39]WMD20240.1 fimbrial protein [Achromobacter sp. R39]